MPRRKLEKRHIRKLSKVGRGASVAVTLPIELVRRLKWRAGQKVVVEKYGKGILIVDWPKKKRK